MCSTDEFEILKKMKGSELKGAYKPRVRPHAACQAHRSAGLKYEPLFDYFPEAKERGAFIVLTDGYVTEGSGTGVVHQAPAFGEDDYRVCLAAGVIERGAGAGATRRDTCDAWVLRARLVQASSAPSTTTASSRSA